MRTQLESLEQCVERLIVEMNQQRGSKAAVHYGLRSRRVIVTNFCRLSDNVKQLFQEYPEVLGGYFNRHNLDKNALRRAVVRLRESEEEGLFEEAKEWRYLVEERKSEAKGHTVDDHTWNRVIHCLGHYRRKMEKILSNESPPPNPTPSDSEPVFSGFEGVPLTFTHRVSGQYSTGRFLDKGSR